MTTPEGKGRLNGYGPYLINIIAALVCSGIIGLIVNYGWSKAVDVQIGGLCKDLNKVEESIKTLFRIASDNSLTNIEQKIQIQALQKEVELFRSHQEKDKKE